MSYRIDNRYYSIDPRYNSGYEDGRKASKGKIKDLELANAEYRDTIAQQAERIKELEASLASMVQGVKISIPTQTMEQEFQSHYRRGYEAGKAALRQRIDDAPVVAWLHTQSNGCSSLIRTPPSAFDPQDLADAEVSIYALISKENLT